MMMVMVVVIDRVEGDDLNGGIIVEGARGG